MKKNGTCLRCGKTIWHCSKHCKQCQNIVQPRGIAVNKIRFFSEEHLAKIRAALKGRVISEAHRAAISRKNLGRKLSLAVRMKMSRGHLKPGTRTKIQLIKFLRGCLSTQLWRTGVFKRDKYTCQICGQIGGKLQADHIIPFSFLFKEAVLTGDFSYLFDLENGQTLCVKCHVQTDTYAEKAKNHVNNRLFATFESLWSQEGKKGNFEDFYRLKMDKVIEVVKAKLD